MSPVLKKVLLIGGAAAVAYVVYSKMRRPTALTNAQKLQLAIKSGAVAPTAFQSRASGSVSPVVTFQAKIGGVEEALGVLEELGLEGSLGSLGGRRR